MRFITIILLVFSGFTYGQDSLRNENQKKIEDLKKRISLLEGDGDSEVAENASQDEYQSLQDSINFLKKELENCSKTSMQQPAKVNNTTNEQEGYTKNTTPSATNSEQLIYFEHNIYQLNSEQKKEIDAWVQKNKANLNYIMILGHADQTGSIAVNEKISRQRAEAIQAYLISKHKIDQEKLLLNWFGNNRPQTDNKSNNRRCSLSIL